MRDVRSGTVEADIVINGRPLTFAESVAVKVAINDFVWRMRDPVRAAEVGESLAGAYVHHLTEVQNKIQTGIREQQEPRAASNFDGDV